MKRFILTTMEANVLGAFYSEWANIYELANGARLPPSRLKDVLSNLVEKGLVEFDPEKPDVILTANGRYARMLLDKHSKRNYPSHQSASKEIVITDEDVSEKYMQLNEDEVDKELRDAIDKLV